MILAARHAAETAAASTSCPQRADDLSPLLMTCNAAEAQTTASTSPLRTTGTATAQRNASKSPLRTTSNTTADQAPEDIAAGVLPSAQSAGPRQQQQQQQQQQKHQPGGCKPEGTASDAPPTAHCSPRQQQQSEKTATAVMGSQEAEEEASPPRDRRNCSRCPLPPRAVPRVCFRVAAIVCFRSEQGFVHVELRAHGVLCSYPGMGEAALWQYIPEARPRSFVFFFSLYSNTYSTSICCTASAVAVHAPPTFFSILPVHIISPFSGDTLSPYSPVVCPTG